MARSINLSDSERLDHRTGEPLRATLWVGGQIVGTMLIQASGLNSSELAECERILVATSALLGKELTARREASSYRSDREERKRSAVIAAEARTSTSLVGESPDLRETLASVARAVRSDQCVLLRGEPGTEKPWVAAMLHGRSPRATGPFVAVDTTEVDANQLAMQIFGQVRTLPSGATEDIPGRIDEAESGTLYLDDVGTLSLQAQSRLLNLIVDRKLCRFGTNDTATVDLRLIAATSLPLEELVSAGRFRRDLFYAIAGSTVVLPPLRARARDIQRLAEHFLARYAASKGRSAPRISIEAMKILNEYAWPRNVQELEEVVTSAASRAKGEVVTKLHLPPQLSTDPSGRKARSRPKPEVEGESTQDSGQDSERNPVR